MKDFHELGNGYGPPYGTLSHGDQFLDRVLASRTLCLNSRCRARWQRARLVTLGREFESQFVSLLHLNSRCRARWQRARLVTLWSRVRVSLVPPVVSPLGVCLRGVRSVCQFAVSEFPLQGAMLAVYDRVAPIAIVAERDIRATPRAALVQPSQRHQCELCLCTCICA